MPKRAKMRIVSCIFAVFGLGAGVASALGAQKPETPHLEFVTEYIRELAAIETIRDSAKEELKEAGDDANEKLSSAIHSNTLFQLELQSEIGMLKGMRLNSPYDALIPDIADFYDFKITVYKRLTDIASAFLAGPKPDVDYGGLAVEMPQLRARLDYLDQTLFHDITPLVFIILIDPKPDSQNHVSHLIITKAERAILIDTLTNYFGAKMEQKDRNFGVGSALVLRDSLNQRKCSDDPWE